MRSSRDGDAPGLVLRYDIDTSRGRPREAEHFAEYLASRSMQVDVWDGDAMMHLGSMSMQLLPLMRQGQPVVKYHGEFDVVRHDGGSDSVVRPGALLSGTVVGRVQGAQARENAPVHLWREKQNPVAELLRCSLAPLGLSVLPFGW